MSESDEKRSLNLRREPTLNLANTTRYGHWFKPHTLHFTDKNGNDVEWNSRRARKGRYTSKHHHTTDGDVYLRVRHVEDELRPHLIADVSFWIAVSFTVGCVIWVINGFLAWLPHVDPSKGSDEMSLAGASIGLGGAVLFEVGAYLMVVEALDRGRETDFGTALGRVLGKDEGSPPSETSDTKSTSHDMPKYVDEPVRSQGFVWWGKPLWHDIGYVAALIMFIAASIFAIATITGMPGCIPGMEDGKHVVITDIFYVLPQVIGGIGFTVASVLLMLETQTKWWRPNPLTIGWQIGFWNVVGSVGFLLCGALAFSSNSGAAYQSSLATFWGSCAFLLGSACQLWETLWREPPEKDDRSSA